MPRKLKIAAIQMDATFAPTPERLARAADLVAEAASSGAELIVLPECFNTGYAFVDSNYDAAEPIEGQTVSWMKDRAAQHNVHLAGSLMLCDAGEVYNSALLFAPDARMWRYDKQYPFAWERAYFREGNDITVADTDLGQLGMMICWDSAHSNTWQLYAGKVDAMIIPSCPPRFSDDVEVVFFDGLRSGGVLKSGHFADQDIHDQAAWLKIPVVHASGNGKFRSPVPMPALTLGNFLAFRPSAWLALLSGKEPYLEAEYGQHTKIINRNGELVGQVETKTDGYTLAEVELSDEKHKPAAAQPAMRTSGLIFLMVDVMATSLTQFLYRREMKRRSKCQG